MARLDSISVVVIIALSHAFSIIQPAIADVNSSKTGTNGARVYKPRVLYFTSDNTIRNIFYEGDSLSLACVKNTSERRENHLVWKWKPSFFKNSEAEELNDHFRPPNTKVSVEVNYTETNGVHSVASRLHLSTITRNSSGSYICYDKTDGQNHTALMSLHLNNIQEAPAFVTPQRSKFLIGRLHSKEKEKVFSQTVPSGSRFRLSCNLQQPVTNATQWIPYSWDFMPKEQVSDPDTYYGNEALPWEARWKTYVIGPQSNQWMFEVQNANFLDTGLYVCTDYERDRSVFNYIFVQDKTQMILPPNEENLKLGDDSESKAVYVFRSQPENLYHNLGCGPTDPQVTVDLWDSKGTKLASSNDSYSIGANWTFNPFQGFQLNTKAITWDIEGDYVCSTADGRQKRRFKIIVLGVDVIVERGKATNPNEFVLTCKGKTVENKAANLAWYWKSSSAFPGASQAYLTDERIRSWNCTNEDYYDEKAKIFVNRIICENEPADAAGSFECKDRYTKFPPARYNLVRSSETLSLATLPYDWNDYVRKALIRPETIP